MRHFELFSSYFHQWLLTFFFPKLSLVAGKLFDKIIDLLHGPSSQDDTPSSRSGTPSRSTPSSTTLSWIPRWRWRRYEHWSPHRGECQLSAGIASKSCFYNGIYTAVTGQLYNWYLARRHQRGSSSQSHPSLLIWNVSGRNISKVSRFNYDFFIE